MLNIKHTPFCPCNTTTLPDGMFSICILILEIEIYLDAALSPYQTFILLIKHSHLLYSESCLTNTPPAVTVAFLNTLN